MREELARGVRLVHRIGEAVQFFHAEDDDAHYRMKAAFFLVEFTDEVRGPAEHDLVWLPLDQRSPFFFHKCHDWAVGQAVALRQRQGVLMTRQPKEGCGYGL